ncbi:MAG: serine hydrolase [Alphaproteobacteria bacterium]|nr:serine hydrolase [Alphaproteobacteria bacterium]
MRALSPSLHLCLLLTLSACRGLERFDTPIPPDDPWRRETPDAETLARFEAARDYSQTHNGLALVVLQEDAVLFEDFYNGHSASTPWPLWSGTKTFSCAAAMLAVDEGLMTLDEPVAETFPEEFGEGDRAEVTLRQLLQFTSGLKEDWWMLSRDGWAANPRLDDKYDYAIHQPLAHPPGEVFEYGSVHLTAFGAVLEAKLGGSPLDWMEANIFEPIGFRTSGWHIDPSGNPMMPYGAWTTAGEWTKFAALLRDDGVFLGERVLPEGTLAACAQGSTPNPAYGLALWLNQEVPDDLDLSELAHVEPGGPIIWKDGPADLVMAAGARGQRAYIVPSQDLVVIHVADDGGDFVDAELLALLLGG